MKKIRQIPLFLLVIISGFLLTYIGYKGSDTYYQDYKYEITKTPYITVVMKGLYDDISPITVLLSTKEVLEVLKAENKAAQDKEESTKDENSQENSLDTSEDTVAETTVETTGTGVVSDATQTTDVIKEFELVEDDYFDNALFIGDSRTIGFSQYAGLVNAKYYADTGINIFSIMEKEIVEDQGLLKKITVDQALQKNTFEKIYIMLGINELGRGTTEDFVAQYALVIARIQELQPRAYIFIQSIMHVSEEKSTTDPIFTNANINARNEGLKTLANNTDIFYLDVNEAVSDELGNLCSDYSFDGVHLKAEYIVLWKDYLKQHGIVTNSVPKVCYEWEAPGYISQD